MAERWVLFTNVAAAGADRRIHAGILGDSGGTAVGSYEVIETLADVMRLHGTWPHSHFDSMAVEVEDPGESGLVCGRSGLTTCGSMISSATGPTTVE